MGGRAAPTSKPKDWFDNVYKKKGKEQQWKYKIIKLAVFNITGSKIGLPRTFWSSGSGQVSLWTMA